MAPSDNARIDIIFLIVSLSIGIIVRRIGLQYKISIPYTVILLVSGFIIGLLLLISHDNTADFILSERIWSTIDANVLIYAMLPVLLFESAFNIDYQQLWNVRWGAFILAGPGVVFCTVLTGIVARLMFDYDFSWYTAMMFGAILSATDPVAVVAVLREVGASKTLVTLIEAESLVNDGAAYVLYLLFSKLVLQSSMIDAGDEVGNFFRISVGGPLWGLFFAWITKHWLNTVFNQPEVEITSTLISAYVCFFIAQSYLGVSAILSIVMFGFYLSRYKHCVSPDVQRSLAEVWSFLSFVANTIIFVSAGMILTQHLVMGSAVRPVDFAYLIALYVAINVIRGLAVLIFSPLIMYLGLKLTWENGLMTAWSGLRGPLSLILGLLT